MFHIMRLAGAITVGDQHLANSETGINHGKRENCPTVKREKEAESPVNPLQRAPLHKDGEY